MNEITTTDLSKFGWREREMAADLIRVSCEQGFPDDFRDEEVKIMFNKYSGYVFFTNADYQVCMMNGNQLESFYTLPYSGLEGFANELLEEYRTGGIANVEDIEYMQNIGILENEEIADAE